MSGRSDRRFSIEPLERLFSNSDEEQQRRQWTPTADPDRVLASVVAERLSLPNGTVYRYRREGIPLRSADRLAIQAGYHPVEVWPDFHSED